MANGFDAFLIKKISDGIDLPYEEYASLVNKLHLPRNFFHESDGCKWDEDYIKKGILEQKKLYDSINSNSHSDIGAFLVLNRITSIMNTIADYLLLFEEGKKASTMDHYIDGLIAIKNDLPQRYREYIELFDDSVKSIDVNSAKKSDYERLTTKLEVKDVLEIVNGIFKDTPFYGIFLDYYKRRNQLLSFSKKKINDTWGCASTIGNDTFIWIAKQENIQDVLSLAHEIGHIIGDCSKTNKNARSKDLLYEIESIFFQLVATDYCLQLGIEDAQITGFLDFANYSAVNRPLKDAYYVNDLLNRKRIKKEGKERIAIVPKRIYNTLLELDNICKDSCIYSMSFMIAVELFSIYRQNPKEAYRMLKRITRIDEAYMQLPGIQLMGIKLGNHLENYGLEKELQFKRALNR